MQKYDYVIIGGGVAGTVAAETIRQNDENGTIAIISDEPYPFYSRIMLSKSNFFLGKVPLESIFRHDHDWYVKNTIDLKNGVRATALNADTKTITLNSNESLAYTKLLLAIGGCARTLGLANETIKGIYCVRTLDDAKNIINTIKTAHKAIVVGAGFIGFEMCDILKLAGLDVTLIIREPFFWGHLLNQKAGNILEKTMADHGIAIIKEDEIASIEGKETLTGIATKNGHRIKADVLTVGVGVTCPIDVLHAQESIQNKQGIVTNEYLETSQKDIWAAGDCAEYFDTILDEYVQMGNWANAQLQGKIAGLNMTGKRTAFAAVTNYTCSGFGLSIAFVGDVRKGEGKELIERIPDDTRSYCHVIIKDNRVIGAAMINRTAELPAITALIKNKIDISNKKDILVSGNIATL